MAKERKVWFITRPERDPKFHDEAMAALQKATDDFSVKWANNREAHKQFESVLSQSGLKRNNISDSGSGGRTWAAMLRTFAYCYTNEDGYLVPTKAGRKLIEGEKVFDNIKKQILTLQIPNAYFLESGFRPKFEEDFSIRPARFLIKLTNQPDLNYYVTKEEITYFVLTAKKDNELTFITEKILEFRHATDIGKQEIRQHTAEVYDHRERSDKGARDFEMAHSDVAHTFMLISDYTGLVEYIRGDSLRAIPADSKKVSAELAFFDERYPFNNRYKISPQRMAENNGLDVDSFKASGYGTEKPATSKNKLENKIKKTLESYPAVDTLSTDEIKEILQKVLPPRDAEAQAFELKERSYGALNTDFVEAYLNEKDPLAFEDKTGEIFKAIGFDVMMRPKPHTPTTTKIEILLKYGDKECGIIDAKNHKKFNLSASLASHMVTEYLPHYDGIDGRDVQFFGYVSATTFSGEKTLKKITEKIKDKIPDREIQGMIISAPVLLAFLDYCLEENLSKQERVALFLKAFNNTGYDNFGKLLKAVNN
ncbi:AlwI family type II restriction endonuclease [Tumebacillus lacus]|nr:AlwI family type II restriction endonuclease [Tumebacillus lacus]